MPPRKRLEADVPDGDVPATRLWMRPVNPATLSSNEQMLLNNMEVISSQLSLITNMLLGGQTIQTEAGADPPYTGKPLATFVEDVYPIFREFLSDAAENKPLTTRTKNMSGATTRFKEYAQSHDFAGVVSEDKENHDLKFAIQNAPDSDFTAMYITLSKRLKEDQKPKPKKRKGKGDDADEDLTSKIGHQHKDNDAEPSKKRRKVILDSDEEEA